MARKKLLTEGEIRHFMKLANLTPLTETYLSEQPEEEELALDVGVEEGPPEGGEMPPDMDMGMEPEEGDLEDEGDPLLDIPEEAREELLGDLVDLLADRLGVDASVEGGEELEVDADVEMDLEEPGVEGAPEDVEMEMGAELDVEEPGMRNYQEGQQPEELEELERGGVEARRRKEGPTGGYAEDERRKQCEDKAGDWTWKNGKCLEHGAAAASDPLAKVAEEQEAIVAEVARRVAARLVADKQREEVSDQLAERIFARLTAKK